MAIILQLVLDSGAEKMIAFSLSILFLHNCPSLKKSSRRFLIYGWKTLIHRFIWSELYMCLFYVADTHIGYILFATFLRRIEMSIVH